MTPGRSRQQRRSAERRGENAPDAPAGPRSGKGRRRWIVAVVVVVAVGGAAAVLLLRGGGGAGAPAAGTSPLPAPVGAPASDVAYSDFTGSDACASCHPSETSAWRTSTHGRAGGAPTLDRVIARFDGRPVRMKDASFLPRADADGFRFVVRRDGSEETDTLRVDGVIGGGHMAGGGTQGFVSRRMDGTYRFLPFDWSRSRGGWFCNTEGRAGAGWVPISDTLSLSACSDYPPARVLGAVPRFSNCQQCHGSQIDVSWSAPARAYDSRILSLAVNCESCHGPGRRHVELEQAGGAKTADIGIAVLDTLPTDASLGVCFQCHALKDALAPGYLPGRPLEDHYALKFPILGDRPYTADGRIRTFGYQATHLSSDCYLNGSMTCTDCHDPHSQHYRDVAGRALPGRFDDGQCLDCHPSKTDVARHTHHPARSDGSRCTSCHMPYLQHPEVGQAIHYTRSDHTIPIPRPGSDEALGTPDACALCHRDRPVASLADTVRAWWGAPKPRRPGVTATLAADSARDPERAARLLLRPGTGWAVGEFAGMAEFAERFLAPDSSMGDVARSRLLALAADSDLDVRALALASLHLSAGREPRVRRALVDALQTRDAAADRALRLRWTAALAYFGDRFSAAGKGADAEAAYAKALEVLPGDARLLTHLGLVRLQAGDVAGAEAAFRRSLAADSAQPLTLVNLGIALESAGRAEAALEAWTRAARMDPWEPAPLVDLGNAYLRAGEAARAVPYYRRALELDPGLADVAFRLGRALILGGRYAEALAAVRQGLRFRPDDPTGRQMLADLQRATAATAGDDGT